MAIQKLEFFMALDPPTTTHQEKQVRVVNGKPVFYEPQEVKTARQKLRAHLSHHIPEETFTGPLQLTTWWCFSLKGQHKNMEYRTSKPDTDNLVKMLKDVMTDLSFWKDDAQVAREVIEKYWAKTPGIYVRVDSLTKYKQVVLLGNHELMKINNDIYNGFWRKYRDNVPDPEDVKWVQILEEATNLVQKYKIHPLVVHQVQDYLDQLECRCKNMFGKGIRG